MYGAVFHRQFYFFGPKEFFDKILKVSFREKLRAKNKIFPENFRLSFYYSLASSPKLLYKMNFYLFDYIINLFLLRFQRIKEIMKKMSL